jgi:type IV pilus assembly protein PilQ
MADRHHRTHREPTGAAKAAWMLAVLAGTPLACAQFDLGGASAPDPRDIARTQDSAPAMRDPMDGKSLIKEGEVKVSDHLIVELHVKDEDLANVLQMLSIQSQINIIASKNVSATVTADLYGASFFEALDAILHVNGYGYVEKGNFIYVYTADELQAIQDANRRTIHKTVHLDYLNAADAAEFAKPLLSDKGVITTQGTTPDFTIADNAPNGKDSYALGAIMVVNDYEENVEQIESLIKEIDTRPAQVLVEATVLQTTLTEDNAFGIDFTVLGSLDMADFTGLGGPLEAVNGLLTGTGKTVDGTNVQVPDDGDGGALTQTVGQTQGPGGLKVGVVAGDVAAFLKVLDEVSNTTVISRPNILTLNRQPARVLVGTKVGYLSSTSTDTSTTQTVQFLDTGTQLYFRPFVSRDGMIRMELKPQVSNATIRDVTDSGGSTVTIPDENTSELSTNVIVRDGNTIVLGGLFTESTFAGRRQVPFLGDLPVLGQAFRGNDDATDRAEIIFMIKPTIVNDQLLLEQGARGDEYINHARAGAREGLLIWSRERQTARLLVSADRKERAGDIDGALYCVERALSLNHFQPEAVAMRERLSAKKREHPSRSLLDVILKNESGINPAMKDDHRFGPYPADETTFALGEGDQTQVETQFETQNEPRFEYDVDTSFEAETTPTEDVATVPQASIEQERTEAELASARAELARVNRQIADQQARYEADRKKEAAALAVRQNAAQSAASSQAAAQTRPQTQSITRSADPARTVSAPAPLDAESREEVSQELGLTESDDLFTDEFGRTITGSSPADESDFFSTSIDLEAPVDGSLGQFTSDQVDSMIDDIAADVFWNRSTSEKYLNGLSSGRRGAPMA